jgi:formylglycine-generating enzyme required for sulfatase activity
MKRVASLISVYSRQLIIGGIGIIVLLLIIFVQKAVSNNTPAATETPTITSTATLQPPTSTATEVPPTVTFTPNIPTRTPPPSMGSTKISEKDGMVLVFVPAGEYLMGDADSGADALPVHNVFLDEFWIDQTEVTNAMYSKCVADGKCELPNNKFRYKDLKYANHPVLFVEWSMAEAYCTWAGRRLPTEAEWEKAARGIDGNIYPWGNEPPNEDLLNFNFVVDDTTEVGSYPKGASVYGVLDMAGNAWEWVNDWYGSNYYSYSLGQNPPGPNPIDVGRARVLRGGSWESDERFVRSAYRSKDYPANPSHITGFRCVLGAPSPYQ